jgi:chromosome segregation ATPase
MPKPSSDAAIEALDMAFEELQDELMERDQKLASKLTQAFSEIESRLKDLEQATVQLRSELNKMQRGSGPS